MYGSPLHNYNFASFGLLVRMIIRLKKLKFVALVAVGLAIPHAYLVMVRDSILHTAVSIRD